MIRAHGIDTMMYADDCQLYITIKRSNRRVALDQLELCIDDVLRWNTQNYVGTLRKFLSQKDTERVVHAFISSKLDFCNGLFYGLPSS